MVKKSDNAKRFSEKYFLEKFFFSNTNVRNKVFAQFCVNKLLQKRLIVGGAVLHAPTLQGLQEAAALKGPMNAWADG